MEGRSDHCLEATTAVEAMPTLNVAMKKVSVAAVITVCIVAMLAGGSITVLLPCSSTNDNIMQHEDIQLQAKVVKREVSQSPSDTVAVTLPLLAERMMDRNHVQALITKLTYDLDVPELQLIEMMIGADGMLTRLARMSRSLAAAHAQLNEAIMERENMSSLIMELNQGINDTVSQLMNATKGFPGKIVH